MSSNALYRKLRPSMWSDLIGQKVVVKTLQNQIKHDNLTHAYLFCGTRGTGKTSSAKLFAKTINCENKQIVNDIIEPCNKCETCISINNNASFIVTEIDAASNNGVDNIRDIIDDVKYAVSKNNYRVYIIDEVHMLSIGAFNAFLKTLEEPPERVIFILATTDVHKLPSTILSRVQRFDFKRITESEIQSALSKYSKSEGIDITDEAISYIAMLSGGGMRDALSILDQANAFYYGECISYENIVELLGGIDTTKLLYLLDCLVRQDTEDTITTFSEIVAEGRDIVQLINELLQLVRDLLVVKVSEKNVILSDSLKNLYKKLSDVIDIGTLVVYVDQLSKLASEVKYSSSKKTVVELYFIKICNPMLIEQNEALNLRIDTIEQKQQEIQENGIMYASRSVESSPQNISDDQFAQAYQEQEYEQRYEEYNQNKKADDKNKVVEQNSNNIKIEQDTNSPYYDDVQYLNKYRGQIRSKLGPVIRASLEGQKEGFLADGNNIVLIVLDETLRNVLDNSKDKYYQVIKKFLHKDFNFVINTKEQYLKSRGVVQKNQDENLSKHIDFPIKQS